MLNSSCGEKRIFFSQRSKITTLFAESYGLLVFINGVLNIKTKRVRFNLFITGL